jgi:hypothetical protein
LMFFHLLWPAIVCALKVMGEIYFRGAGFGQQTTATEVRW